MLKSLLSNTPRRQIDEDFGERMTTRAETEAKEKREGVMRLRTAETGVGVEETRLSPREFRGHK